jgi:hypothetical protein
MIKGDPTAELNSLRRLTANKKCFDCTQSGTTYIISEFSIFVCSRCAGLHREFSHRAKGLSMCSFTADEVVALRGGNETAAKKWHSRLTVRDYPDISQPQRIKDFIRECFIEKRYYASEETPAKTAPPPAVVHPISVSQPKPAGRPWAAFEETNPTTMAQPGPTAPDLMFVSAQPTPPTSFSAFSATFEPSKSLPTDLFSNPPASPAVSVATTASPPTGHSASFSLFPLPAPSSPYPSSVPRPPGPVQTPILQAFPPHSVPQPPYISSAESPTAVSHSYMPQAMHPGAPQPYHNPFSGNLSSVWHDGVKDDPFLELVEQDIERQRQARPQPASANPQQVLWQQYLMQAQLYSQSYGAQYPYSFQAWLQMLNLAPPTHPTQPHPEPVHAPLRPVVRSTNPFDGL